MSTDKQHQKQLKRLMKQALKGSDKFSDWARRLEIEQEVVYQEIINDLGKLKINKPWSVFAEIYNEDTPEKIFESCANFIEKVLIENQIDRNDLILDIACGTGSISRLLNKKGFKRIKGFDECPEMIQTAKKISKNSNIKYETVSIVDLDLIEKASAAIWFDFSSNFALNNRILREWLESIIKCLEKKWNFNF